MAFARKLPEPGDLIAEAESLLKYGPEFWTNEAFFERGLEEMKKIGAPRWLINYVMNRRKRLNRQKESRKQPGTTQL